MARASRHLSFSGSGPLSRGSWGSRLDPEPTKAGSRLSPDPAEPFHPAYFQACPPPPAHSQGEEPSRQALTSYRPHRKPAPAPPSVRPEPSPPLDTLPVSFGGFLASSVHMRACVCGPSLWHPIPIDLSVCLSPDICPPTSSCPLCLPSFLSPFLSVSL